MENIDFYGIQEIEKRAKYMCGLKHSHSVG